MQLQISSKQELQVVTITAHTSDRAISRERVLTNLLTLEILGPN